MTVCTPFRFISVLRSVYNILCSVLLLPFSIPFPPVFRFSAGRKSEFDKLATRVPVLSIGNWLASRKTFHFACDGVHSIILRKNLNTERIAERVPALSIGDRVASRKTFYLARGGLHGAMTL